MRLALMVIVALLLVAALALWQLAAGDRPAGPVIASGLPRSLDPVAASRLDEIRLVGALFEALVRIDPSTLKMQPALASSWQISPDRLTWTFYLRANACWSDGTPLVSADMRRGLVRHLSEGSPYASLLASLVAGGEVGGDGSAAAITCPDDHTLVVRVRGPAPDPLAILSLPLFVPATQAQVTSGRGEGWSDPVHMVGNGPLVCVDHRPRHHYDFAPNPFYRGFHPARGSLRVLVVEDSGCAQRLYLDGQIDAIPVLQSDAIRDLGRAQVPGLLRGPSFTVEFLRVRLMPRSPKDSTAITQALRHPRLRLALARAIDRATLAREVMDGLGEPATIFTPASLATFLPYHPSTSRLAYDVHQARVDLAAAQADLGPIPDFELLVSSTPLERLRGMEFIVDCWRRTLGLSVHLVVKPTIEVRAQEERGDFDLSRGVWLGDYVDPTTFLDVWRADSRLNRGGFADQEYDALLNAASRTTGEERWRLLEKAEERLTEQVPFIPLVNTTCNMLVRPGLIGLAPNPMEYVWLDEVGWR